MGTVGFGQKEHHSEQVRNSTTEQLYERVMEAAEKWIWKKSFEAWPVTIRYKLRIYLRVREPVCQGGGEGSEKSVNAPVYSYRDRNHGTGADPLLKEEGANLEQVCIGHMDRNPDLWYYRELLKNGVFHRLDQISKIKVLYRTDKN